MRENSGWKFGSLVGAETLTKYFVDVMIAVQKVPGGITLNQREGQHCDCTQEAEERASPMPCRCLHLRN